MTAPASPTTTPRFRVLLIEDERDLVDGLVYNLQRQGYETMVAYEGHEGLRKAQTHVPDLILLDIMLPGLSGTEICRELRAGERTRDIPIIILSAKAEETDQVVGFSLGAYFALDLSATDPEHIRSVTVFYGTGPADYSRSRADYLGHFAETDEFEPQSEVDKLEAALRRAGRPATFHRYAGTGHWFFEPDRPNAFNRAAASLAWDRTLAFLRRPLT